MSAPNCPFCDAVAVERVGQWGGQMITAQWRCQVCNTYFEAVRPEFDDSISVQATARSASSERK